MKSILVVYAFEHEHQMGYGNIDFTVNYDVPRISSIREMERQICEKFKFDHAVIMNVIKLDEEIEDTE
jgi:predicted RNase H-related nuclease YkuK (DUF458 family)